MTQKPILYFSIGVAIMLISMIAYNIFGKTDEYVGKHIQELKYEQGQIHKDENQQTQEKLDGQGN